MTLTLWGGGNIHKNQGDKIRCNYIFLAMPHILSYFIPKKRLPKAALFCHFKRQIMQQYSFPNKKKILIRSTFFCLVKEFCFSLNI